MFADSFFETAGCWGVTRGANAKGLLIEVLLSQAHEHGGALNRRQFGAALPRTGSVGINSLGVDKLFLAFDAEARGRVKVEDLHALRAQSRAGGAQDESSPLALVLQYFEAVQPLSLQLAEHADEALAFVRKWDYDGDGKLLRADFQLATMIDLGFKVRPSLIKWMSSLRSLLR